MGENITRNLSVFSSFIARNANLDFWDYLPAVNINISLYLRNNDSKPRASGESIVDVLNNTHITSITLIWFK